MTPEQISELRRNVIEWTGGHREAAYAGTASGTILRALDERAELLEALKDAAETIELMPTGDDQFARAAIAKAEAP